MFPQLFLIILFSFQSIDEKEIIVGAERLSNYLDRISNKSVGLLVNHSSKIKIEDGVFITARCMLLNHKRDLSSYSDKIWIGDCKHKIGKIHIKKGAHIGVGTIILPNVVIGRGSIIGAGSVVTKDIPDYSIAVGSPAKVIRKIK